MGTRIGRERGMTAIETWYKGIRFRSRLEARWAVLFDALGLPWQFEPDVVTLLFGRYVPDFWMPTLAVGTSGLGAYAEVKPAAFTAAEWQKCRELAELRSAPVLMLIGPPADALVDVVHPRRMGSSRVETRELAALLGVSVADLTAAAHGTRGARFGT